MVDIDVDPMGSDDYRVTVTDDDGHTVHKVSVARSRVDLLGAGRSAADLLIASFRFLLDRESKESILPSFELDQISRYFPDYESSLAGYLDPSTAGGAE